MRKPAEKNDKAIQDVLKDFAKQNKITPGFYNSKVNLIWKTKMGTTINNYTRKVSLAKGTLYLKIDSAPLKSELLMSKQKIIDLINSEMKSDIVKKVVIN